MKKKKRKYPKYTREEALNCKLSDEEINRIQELHSMGLRGIDIWRKRDVLFKEEIKSPVTIYRWLLSEERRKELNKKNADYAKENRDSEKAKEYAKKCSRRKIRLKGHEVYLYRRSLPYWEKAKVLTEKANKRWREKNRERYKEWRKEYNKKYRSKPANRIRRKEYYQENKDRINFLRRKRRAEKSRTIKQKLD
jgi:hypothetical protein